MHNLTSFATWVTYCRPQIFAFAPVACQGSSTDTAGQKDPDSEDDSDYSFTKEPKSGGAQKVRTQLMISCVEVPTSTLNILIVVLSPFGNDIFLTNWSNDRPDVRRCLTYTTEVCIYVGNKIHPA